MATDGSRRIMITVAVVLWSGISHADRPQSYAITELPALEAHPSCPTYSNATAINERGDVVGVAESSWFDSTCHYVTHAVIWRAGQIIDLGGIPPRDAQSRAKGINDNGDAVVGLALADLASGGAADVPFYWNETDGMIGLDAGDPSPDGQAWGVNNAHQVALQYNGRAHTWDAVTGFRLIAFDDTPPGFGSNAWEINNHGLVVGEARRADLNFHAFRYDSASDAILDLHDPAYRSSGAYGINDHGDVAGWINAFTNENYASVWPAGGGRIDLPIQVFGPGYVYCRAEHVNDLGDVVGTDVSASTEPSIGWVAFDLLGGNLDKVALVDLLSPADAAGWQLTAAFEINGGRQITGIGLYHGVTLGFLMRPAAIFADGFESGDTSAWSTVQR